MDLTLAFPKASRFVSCLWGWAGLTLPTALSSPRSTVPVVHPVPLLLHGDTSCSAQPDLISLLNLFSLRPCVNHFSHYFLPNSLWPDLLLLLLMCLERGSKETQLDMEQDPQFAPGWALSQQTEGQGITQPQGSEKITGWRKSKKCRE